MIKYQEYQPRLAKLESRYTYKPNQIYYFNVHRPTKLVRDLQKRYDFFDVALIPRLIHKALNKRMLAVNYSNLTGTGHLIFFIKVQDLGTLVLRTNLLLSEPEEYMDFEKEFTEMYAKANIPSSRILYSDTTRSVFPFDYQIMELLPGKTLGTDFHGSQLDYEKIIFQQGQMAAREYLVPMKNQGWGRITKGENGNFRGTFSSIIEYINTYLEHDLSVLELFEFISPKDSNKIYHFFHSNHIRDLFADMKHGYLVHNDPSDLNLRYEGDKLVAIFDWENAAIYDPICEIGTAPTWTSHFPKRKKLMEGFIAELGSKPENLEEKMAVYFLRKMLDKIQFALRGQRLALKHIKFFEEGVQACNLDVRLQVSIE